MFRRGIFVFVSKKKSRQCQHLITFVMETKNRRVKVISNDFSSIQWSLFLHTYSHDFAHIHKSYCLRSSSSSYILWIIKYLFLHLFFQRLISIMGCLSLFLRREGLPMTIKYCAMIIIRYMTYNEIQFNYTHISNNIFAMLFLSSNVIGSTVAARNVVVDKWFQWIVQL